MQYTVHKKEYMYGNHAEHFISKPVLNRKRFLSLDEELKTDNPRKKYKSNPAIENTRTSGDYITMSKRNNFGSTEPKIKKESTSNNKHISLAKIMMPTDLSTFVGQTHVIGSDSILYNLLDKGQIHSMVFWGPPGCGKSSLVSVIIEMCKQNYKGKIHFEKLSTASCSVQTIRDNVSKAESFKKFGKKTKFVIVMDEIHRFNKLQQDIFLPHVEAGTFTLIGITTENPYYCLNPALLSRCRILALYPLTLSDVTIILNKAVTYLQGKVQGTSQGNNSSAIQEKSNFVPKFVIDEDTIEWIAEACGGDARIALNGLELTIETKLSNKSISKDLNRITVMDVREGLKRAHLFSEKDADQSHHLYSALHKSIRAGNANAGLYWLARLMAAKEDPVNIARRLVRISAEEVGLADTEALSVAVHTMFGCQMIGMPECDVPLGQCVVYLARAPKSRMIYNALKAAEELIKSHKGPQPPVPSHIQSKAGFTKSSPVHKNNNFFPDNVERIDFFNGL